jgi:hypothetical protein
METAPEERVVSVARLAESEDDVEPRGGGPAAA